MPASDEFRAKPGDAALDIFARLLAEARRILFITGAGISADSGLPTYRDIGGLYEDAATDEGVPIEVALSGPTLEATPTVEINPGRSEVSSLVDLRIRAGARAVLEAVVALR